MALGPRLELRQSQQLVMTPQLQQAIKLLALTNVELETFLAEEIERNPLLAGGEGGADGGAGEAPDLPSGEPGDAPETTPLERLATGPGDGDSFASDDGPAFREPTGDADRGEWTGHTGEPGEAIDFDSFADEGESLAEVLERQATASLSGLDRTIALHLIQLIDPSGYLTEPLDEIAERLGVTRAEVESALMAVQTFEPAGVGARDLAECLAIQAREADRYDPAMRCMIANLPMVARGDIQGLMRSCGVDREDIADMIRELRRYDPKPGLRYGGERSQPVVADIFVTRGQDGEWRVELNQETLPRLLVDRDYLAVLQKGQLSKDSQAFLSDCLAQAGWLMKALDQRQRTILKVAAELVKLQAAFFEGGVAHLKPLTLRAIAETIEMHESTVSRATANKYLQCERGLFELRYFFGSGVSSGDGAEQASALAVKDRIARLIASEPAEPYSDDKLVDMLRAEGFDIARRTVAKYREALGLGSSVQRRRAKLLAAA